MHEASSSQISSPAQNEGRVPATCVIPVPSRRWRGRVVVSHTFRIMKVALYNQAYSSTDQWTHPVSFDRNELRKSKTFSYWLLYIWRVFVLSLPAII